MPLSYKDLISVFFFWWLLTPSEENHKETVGSWITEKATKVKTCNRRVWWLKGKDVPFAGWMVLSIAYHWNCHGFLPENKVCVLYVGKMDGSAWGEGHNVAVSTISLTKLHDKLKTPGVPIFILKLPIISLNSFLKYFPSCSSALWENTVCWYFVKMSFRKLLWWIGRFC